MKLEALQHVSHVTVTELHAVMVAHGSDLSRDTIQRDVRTGRLPSMRVGGVYLVEAGPALAYAATREPYDTLKKEREDTANVSPRTHQG